MATARRCAALTRFLLAIAGLICTHPDPARAAPNRPRIGLALSGGGARGFAHIGVLEWLEQNHVPVDCIAGTSMGGLIAGMYATGMSPAQIRATIRGIDWTTAFGPTPYAALTYRRKEDRRDYQGGLRFGLRSGIAMPSGLDPAHPIGLLLSRIALPYSEVATFDELPIPFRCMAVDLRSGESVTMRGGGLAQAMRATMAIPGLFTPVERDGRVLVDGGILANLPTEALREMGADIILAVDISPTLAHDERLKTIIGLIDQTVVVVLINNVRRSLALADVIIAPNLTDMEDAPYSAVDAFADRGRAAPERRRAALVPYALAPDDWAAYRQGIDTRRRILPATVRDVVVAGAAPRDAAHVAGELRNELRGRLDPPRLERALTLLTGEGRWESATYELMRRSDGSALRVHMREKPFGPPFLDAGLTITGAELGSVTFGLGMRATALNTAGHDSEWRTDALLGSHARVATELMVPIPRTAWFVAPGIAYDARTQGLYSGTARVAEYRTNTLSASLSVGRTFGRTSEFRMGVEAGTLHAAVRTGDPLLPSTAGQTRAVTARWNLDTRDNEAVPTRGGSVELSARWMPTAPDTPNGAAQGEARFSLFQPAGRRDTAVLLASAGSSFGADLPAPLQYTLGGALRLSAYGVGELRGADYLHVAAGSLHRVGRLPQYLGGAIHVGAMLETGGAFDRFRAARCHTGISAGIIAETTFGPVYVGGAAGDAGHRNLFFSLGRLF